MKHKRLIIRVLLNILFCTALIWFFSRNSFLRPFAGSVGKEIIAALFLLLSIYVNYFILYPKLHNKHCVLYWISTIVICLIAACADLAIAYPFMAKCNAQLIMNQGECFYFLNHLLFIFGRNMAFNLFSYMLRMNQSLWDALNTEVQIVYRDIRKIDVTDNHHNCRLISKDDIYYCRQNGNYTLIYVVQGECYTRLGSLKYLEQLFGEKEFVRISPSLLIPYRYINFCHGNEVFLKKLSDWQAAPSFIIENNDVDHIVEQIVPNIPTSKRREGGRTSNLNQKRRKPIIPSSEKTEAILAYIKDHPGAKTTDLSADAQLSSSTIARCLAELRKQGTIRYDGSKKTGGYYAVETPNKKKEKKPTPSTSSEPVQDAKPKRKKRKPRHNAQPQNVKKQKSKE